MEPDLAPARRARLLLALGASAGLVAAAVSLWSPPSGGPGALPEGVVARVNDVLIRGDTYRRALEALASDRREPLGDADRARVLERLVDEELLVQHALSLGLARHDRRVRADLVSGVMGSIVASTDDFEPGDGELEAFYRDHADYFTHPGRLHVRQVFVATAPRRSEAEARERAARAARRLRAGEPIEAVQRALGDEVIAPLPDAPLPPAKLRAYVGPTALRAADALGAGQASDPVRSSQGFHVLQLVAREAAFVPPLTAIRDQVRGEMKRRAGDRAVRERLSALRAAGDVALADVLPKRP